MEEVAREASLVKTRSRGKHCRIAAGGNGAGRIETRIESGTRGAKAGTAVDKAHDNLVANAGLHRSHRKQIKRRHVERTGGGKNVGGELFEDIAGPRHRRARLVKVGELAGSVGALGGLEKGVHVHLDNVVVAVQGRIQRGRDGNAALGILDMACLVIAITLVHPPLLSPARWHRQRIARGRHPLETAGSWPVAQDSTDPIGK